MNRQTKARTRQKVKKLRAKQLMLSIMDRRQRKRMRSLEKSVKGKTVVGISALAVAKYLSPDQARRYMDHSHERFLNQRQRRQKKRSTGIKY